MNEPVGGPQAEFDVAAVATASREIIEAAKTTVAYLQMMVGDWTSLMGSNPRSIGYRELAILEITRMNEALEKLERLQYPSHFKTKGV